jgi:hypothetical protein
MSEHHIEPQTLNDEDTARYIGMSESWLRQSRVAGNPDAPPFLKISKSVRYLRKDLDIWLESQRRTSTLQGHGRSSLSIDRPRSSISKN